MQTQVQAPSRFSGSIAIADKAAEKLKELMLAEKKDPAEFGLRLGVQGGGCSRCASVSAAGSSRRSTTSV